MDYNNKVRIKCPCGANLALNKTPGMEAKSFTCPVCRQLRPFTDFTILPPVQPKPAAQPQAAAAETIDVMCPCGTKLRVKRNAGIEKKNLTCPKCGQKRPFTEYQQPAPKPAAPKPQVAAPPVSSAPRKPNFGDTCLPYNGLSALTQLVDKATGIRYDLKVGVNIIGRKADSSHATIQIDTADKKLSREHFIITGKPVEPFGYKFFISLHKQEVNPTKVNGQLIDFGDEIFLQNGTRISIHHTELIFEVIDTEQTIC